MKRSCFPFFYSKTVYRRYIYKIDVNLNVTFIYYGIQHINMQYLTCHTLKILTYDKDGKNKKQGHGDDVELLNANLKHFNITHPQIKRQIIV